MAQQKRLEGAESYRAFWSLVIVGILLIEIDQGSKFKRMFAFGPEDVIAETEDILCVIEALPGCIAEIRDGSDINGADWLTSDARELGPDQ